MGGWAAVKTMKKAGAYMKGDERILGSGDFVKTILTLAKENMDRSIYFGQKGMIFQLLLTGLQIYLD